MRGGSRLRLGYVAEVRVVVPERSGCVQVRAAFGPVGRQAGAVRIWGRMGSRYSTAGEDACPQQAGRYTTRQALRRCVSCIAPSNS